MVLLTVVGLCGFMFWPALLGRACFAFRDAAHFYYPLFEFVSREWAAGRVPLWNPASNLGEPLLAQNTSSACFPGMLIFLLPVPYLLAYNWYIVGHLLFAAASAYRLARAWQASATGAGLGALAYAFGGHVMFQHANIVYLVGAAWLPLAVLYAERMFSRRQARWAISLGVVLAMMVLGGEPQMAYHAGLLAALYALLDWWQRRRAVDDAPAQQAIGSIVARSRWALLGLAAASGLALAAVQVLPTLELARLSGRGDAAASHDEIYQFNVAPWRFAEFLWPNIGGRQFPIHRRWFSAIPAEGRIWTPSLYIGLLPLVLAMSGWSLRGGDLKTRWLSWMVLLGGLGSLGGYGLGWLLGQAYHAAGRVSPAGFDEVGGLYSLLTFVLPGYNYFRYPAKLMTIASLGLSLLAALNWDAMWQGGVLRGRRWLACLAAISGVATVLLILYKQTWSDWLADAEPDQLFGPLDVTGAFADCIGGLSQAALLALAFLALFQLKRTRLAPFVAPLAVLITAADLAWANAWSVGLAPASCHDIPPQHALYLRKKIVEPCSWYLCNQDQFIRVNREPYWLSEAWSQLSSADRLAESLRWDRATLRPNYHLETCVPLVYTPSTLPVGDFEIFWNCIQQGRPIDRPYYSLDRDLDFLGIGFDLRNSRETLADCLAVSGGNSLYGNAWKTARAWAVHTVTVLPPLKTSGAKETVSRTEEILFPKNCERAWRAEAVVEAESDGQLAQLAPNPASNRRREPCRVADTNSATLDIDVELLAPGLLVVSDLYYPGWQATVETKGQKRSVPILRTNRVMRGVVLPAGKHWVRFEYRPASFMMGATISIMAWVGLAVGLSMGFLRSRQLPKKIRRTE